MTQPVAIALVVCDNVYLESSGKTALVGLFNRIHATKFPIKHPLLCVYLSVTDIPPNTKFKLDIVHSETDHTVVSLEGPSPKGADRTTICDMNFELKNLEFPEPGRYYIRCWGNDKLLVQRPFDAEQIDGKEEKKS